MNPLGRGGFAVFRFDAHFHEWSGGGLANFTRAKQKGKRARKGNRKSKPGQQKA